MFLASKYRSMARELRKTVTLTILPWINSGRVELQMVGDSWSFPLKNLLALVAEMICTCPESFICTFCFSFMHWNIQITKLLHFYLDFYKIPSGTAMPFSVPFKIKIAFSWHLTQVGFVNIPNYFLWSSEFSYSKTSLNWMSLTGILTFQPIYERGKEVVINSVN